jgi:hypothetical protein
MQLLAFTPASADEVKTKASLEGSHPASDKVKYSLNRTTSLASSLTVQNAHPANPQP